MISTQKIEIQKSFKNSRRINDTYIILSGHQNIFALFNTQNQTIDLTYNIARPSPKYLLKNLKLHNLRFEAGFTKDLLTFVILQNNQFCVFDCNWESRVLSFTRSFSLGKDKSFINEGDSASLNFQSQKPVLTPHYQMVVGADGETFYVRFQGSEQMFRVVGGVCRLIRHRVPANFGNSIFDMDGLQERNDWHARGQFVDLGNSNFMFVGYERKKNSIMIYKKKAGNQK